MRDVQVQATVEQVTARTVAARERYEHLLAATRLVMAQADVILSVAPQPEPLDRFRPRDTSGRTEFANRRRDFVVVRES